MRHLLLARWCFTQTSSTLSLAAAPHALTLMPRTSAGGQQLHQASSKGLFGSTMRQGEASYGHRKAARCKDDDGAPRGCLGYGPRLQRPLVEIYYHFLQPRRLGPRPIQLAVVRWL